MYKDKDNFPRVPNDPRGLLLSPLLPCAPDVSRSAPRSALLPAPPPLPRASRGPTREAEGARRAQAPRRWHPGGVAAGGADVSHYRAGAFVRARRAFKRPTTRRAAPCRGFFPSLSNPHASRGLARAADGASASSAADAGGAAAASAAAADADDAAATADDNDDEDDEDDDDDAVGCAAA